MLLKDLKDLFPSETLEIVVNNARQFSAGALVRLTSLTGSSTVYIQPDEAPNGSSAIALSNIEATFATDHYADLWNQIQNSRYFAQVSPVSDNRLSVLVIYAFFEKDLMGDFEIAVTDKQVRNQEDKPLRNVNAVKQHILSDYVLRIKNENYIVVARHPYGSENTFQILDGTNSYSITERSRRELGIIEIDPSDEENEEQSANDPSDMIWAINSNERPFTKKADYIIELWKCGLKLADETTAEKQKAATKAFIESGLDKYLDAWKQYTEIEYQLVQEIQTRAGRLDYREPTWISGRRYKLKIENPQMLADFMSCLDGLGNDSAVEIDASFTGNYGETIEDKRPAKLFEKDGNVEVEMSEGNPLQTGTIRVSIHLATVQHGRREAALDRILTQHAAKPDLAMLIGGEKAVPSGLRNNSSKMSPLSDNVLRIFGSHAPTEAQKTAISIALNTKDFAIIQGPPGTGKTTVINAIMQALTEKEKDPQLTYGNNLLTAYQRDATTHLAEKLRLYGLPTPVYLGERGRGNSGEEEVNVRDVSMDKWIKEKRAELYEANPDIENLQAGDMLADRLHLIRTHFSADTATLSQVKGTLTNLIGAINACVENESALYQKRLAILQANNKIGNFDPEEAITLKRPIIFKDQLETATRMLNEVNSRLDDEQNQLDRYYAGRLAATEAAMSDAGKENSQRILRRFALRKYPPEVMRTVQSLNELYEESPIPCRKVQTRKDILIYQLTKSDWNTIDRDLNSKIENLINGLIGYVEKQNGTDEQRVLVEYHNAFDEDNDNILREWLSDFMTAIAATHQRAVSGTVKSHKGIERYKGLMEEPDVEFSNVLIDEAARSCPPDLLIPLACAKERMILVGDQKQLPQFISEDVYEKISGFSKSELDSLVKKTMFERLITQVQELEKKDHISRFVLLDEQYRMPKTLGDIISEHFYEGKLKSPLGNDANHTPNLPYIDGMHLVWLDVAGGRQSHNEEHSLFRQSEVNAIVRMLKAMVQNSANAKDYTYAIITFYSAQRNRLIQAITADTLLKQWYETGIIKIGTVDAFQGMEADVVFLSLVRSLPKYDKGQNLYGFLANANRQCVALSRAKRCLIIAGDKSMISGTRSEDAKQAMPAIEKIYQLCRKESVTDACILKDRDFAGM